MASAEAYDAALNVSGYSVEGFADADATQLRVSDLFTHVPAAVLKAKVWVRRNPRRSLFRPSNGPNATHQRFVSSRLPRWLIAAFAASAKRCSSQGNVTSSRT